MSEESIETAMEQAAPDPVAAQPTGHHVVDAVLESLEGIDEIPVSEQTPIFEAAQESLRAALADAGNETEA
ncbi:MAG TPA: hypothetical protein VLI04_03860 [Nocardioidaceae bacterium]|nr:hypothetical protein [Nocardioidaceae bacterium]